MDEKKEIIKKKYASQEKYHKKIGLINKSYKLDKKLTEDFLEACKKAETTQAKEITKFMYEFIKRIND